MLSRLVVFVFLLCSTCLAYAEELVLVVSKNTPIKPLSVLELKKLYIGLPVYRSDQNLTPLLNESDSRFGPVFYQFVVGMQSKTYRRKLLRNRMNYAVEPPVIFRRKQQLAVALTEIPYSVSYMWRSEADRHDELVILQVIWHNES